MNTSKNLKAMLKLKQLNFNIILPVMTLSLVGLIFVFEASGNVKLLREQFIFIVLGFAVLMLFAKYPYRAFMKFSVLLVYLAILALILVLIPGIGLKIYGARRWIDLHFMTFQPSEFTKLALIIFFAHWFSNEEKNRMAAFFLLIGLVFILILLQPDMGTAIIIISTSFVMFFSSRTTLLSKIIMMIPVVLLLLLLVIAVSPYRSQRLFSFLNVNKEKYGSNYHSNQALMSIGSGGLFGVGIGKSTQKFSYLPESNTDSIFGIIAEETGFFGSLLVFGTFLVIFRQSYLIMKNNQDLFGKFLSFGIGLFIVLQAFLNLSSMMALMPLTGVPLPFVSSGGSALLVQFAAIGILLNIGKGVKY